MNYREALQAINTQKALALLGLEIEANGAYAKFDCECGEKAVIKVYGEKKNLYYCPKCKLSGHIISLVMRNKKLEYQDALKVLTDKASANMEPLGELDLTYELVYDSEVFFLSRLEEDFCTKYGIGVPKGKTMLSGCVVFTVRNENGVKIAYVGLRLKDNKFIHHRLFNPEMYLFNYHNINPKEEVYVTTGMDMWLLTVKTFPNAVCNFGLPFISPRQLSLLGELPEIVFFGPDDEIKPLIISADKYLEEYLHKFKKK